LNGDADNPARPPPGVELCRLDDLADPGAKGFRFRHGAKMFAGFVVRRSGEVRGYVDSCPHAGWPLAAFDDRYLTRDGGLILCAGHAALFRPEDGACVAGPCAGEALTPWPVIVRAGCVITA
jgi:nitrite reductase/ring-hydroxylating ferredoxin subunit